MNEGPLLEDLTRRLAETPAEFLMEPVREVHPGAVFSDLLRDLGGGPLPPDDLERLRAEGSDQKRNWMRIILISSWLLHHPWFVERKRCADDARNFLMKDLSAVAHIVPAERFVTDPERREELARLCLKSLGLRPAGESPSQAADRLSTVDSVERRRVVGEARKAEERARKIREELKRKAEWEAAAKLARE